MFDNVIICLTSIGGRCNTSCIRVCFMYICICINVCLVVIVSCRPRAATWHLPEHAEVGLAM